MIFNFNAGPAMLPTAVMERAREEFLDWHGSGISVMEHSHRARWFTELAGRCEAGLRQLLHIGEEHAVLFMAGGASTQFALAAMNLAGRAPGGYVVHGHWGQKALAEAQRIGGAYCVATSAADNFRSVPPPDGWNIRTGTSYVHITSNETISGVQIHSDPECPAPLVADMSSDFLSRPVNLAAYDLVYAGAQKNAGPAGITLVIVRREVLERCPDNLPNIFSYRVFAEQRSMYNTPPTFNWYMVSLVIDWLQEQGGLESIAGLNRRKADLLYRCIDDSDYYAASIAAPYRSLMNVVFRTPDEAADRRFAAAAQSAGLHGLQGHRSIGGIRASIYNAMPVDGVMALVEFMTEFERKNG